MIARLKLTACFTKKNVAILHVFIILYKSFWVFCKYRVRFRLVLRSNHLDQKKTLIFFTLCVIKVRNSRVGTFSGCVFSLDSPIFYSFLDHNIRFKYHFSLSNYFLLQILCPGGENLIIYLFSAFFKWRSFSSVYFFRSSFIMTSSKKMFNTHNL